MKICGPIDRFIKNVATVKLPVGRRYVSILVDGKWVSPGEAADLLGVEIVIDGESFLPNPELTGAQRPV